MLYDVSAAWLLGHMQVVVAAAAAAAAAGMGLPVTVRSLEVQCLCAMR